MTTDRTQATTETAFRTAQNDLKTHEQRVHEALCREQETGQLIVEERKRLQTDAAKETLTRELAAGAGRVQKLQETLAEITVCRSNLDNRVHDHEALVNDVQRTIFQAEVLLDRPAAIWDKEVRKQPPADASKIIVDEALLQKVGFLGGSEVPIHRPTPITRTMSNAHLMLLTVLGAVLTMFVLFLFSGGLSMMLSPITAPVQTPVAPSTPIATSTPIPVPTAVPTSAPVTTATSSTFSEEVHETELFVIPMILILVLVGLAVWAPLINAR